MATVRGDGEGVFGAQTIVRALAVLGVLRRTSSDLGVTEMARELSLNPSTTHRVLRALVAEGYVAQDPASGRYRLGREAFLLGRAAERNLGFAAVTPILERLRDETGESVNLVVRDGDEGLVVLRAESEQLLRFAQPVGARIPLYCTSTGKVLLAYASDPQAEVAALGRLERHTATTMTSRRGLLRELTQVADRGYSVNRSESVEGVCGVAAPVVDSQGGVTTAVAVQGPEVRMPEGRLADLAELVVAGATEIAATLPAGRHF